MQAVIESIVTAMVNAKIASADDSLEDSASDGTPVVIDAEAPRRLGVDAPEPRPPRPHPLASRFKCAGCGSRSNDGG